MFSLCLFILAISYQSMLTLKPAWLTHTCSWIGFHSPAWRVTFMTPDLTKDVVCFCFVFVSEFSKGSFVPRLLIFVLKCILFFILHDTVINYIYRKDCDYCGCPHAPHFGTVDYCEWGGGGWQPLLLIWQENFIQMCSFTEKPSCSDSACKSDQNVCELVHACVCTREGGDAWCVMIALMVSGYLCRGMMSNATHTCSLLSFCSSTHTRA